MNERRIAGGKCAIEVPERVAHSSGGRAEDGAVEGHLRCRARCEGLRCDDVGHVLALIKPKTLASLKAARPLLMTCVTSIAVLRNSPLGPVPSDTVSTDGFPDGSF